MVVCEVVYEGHHRSHNGEIEYHMTQCDIGRVKGREDSFVELGNYRCDLSQRTI